MSDVYQPGYIFQFRNYLCKKLLVLDYTFLDIDLSMTVSGKNLLSGTWFKMSAGGSSRCGSVVNESD